MLPGHLLTADTVQVVRAHWTVALTLTLKDHTPSPPEPNEQTLSAEFIIWVCVPVTTKAASTVSSEQRPSNRSRALSHLGFLVDQGLQHLHPLNLHKCVSDKPLNSFEHNQKPAGLTFKSTMIWRTVGTTWHRRARTCGCSCTLFMNKHVCAWPQTPWAPHSASCEGLGWCGVGRNFVGVVPGLFFGATW